MGIYPRLLRVGRENRDDELSRACHVFRAVSLVQLHKFFCALRPKNAVFPDVQTLFVTHIP